MRAHLASKRPFWRVTLLLTAQGCTTVSGDVFTTLPTSNAPSGPTSDASTPATSPSPDASAPSPNISAERLACAPNGPEVAGLFEFETGVTDGRIIDSTGGAAGAIVGTNITRVQGPDDCGMALEFSRDNRFFGDSYAVIPDRPEFHLEEGSIEMWLWLDHEAVPPGPATAESATPGARGVGIVVRDAYMTTETGHFALMLTESGRLVARLQAVLPSEVNRCSKVVPTARWFHVAVNFGAPRFELYIDGQEHDEPGSYLFEAPCGGDLVLGLSGNENPWVIGADATTAEDGAPLPHRPDGYLGAARIDHLRISKERFVATPSRAAE